MRLQKPQRRGGRGPRRAARAVAALWLVGLVGLALAAIGCALGPEDDPGCHADSECVDGFTCRAGACFRATTDASPPLAADASVDGDG